MKTAIKQPEAVSMFTAAAIRHSAKQQQYEQEAEKLRKNEEDERNALPWYSRMWTTLNWLTGFEQDIRAQRARENLNYCEKQLRILQTLSPRSRICLCQKDLDVLRINNE